MPSDTATAAGGIFATSGSTEGAAVTGSGSCGGARNNDGAAAVIAVVAVVGTIGRGGGNITDTGSHDNKGKMGSGGDVNKGGTVGGGGDNDNRGDGCDNIAVPNAIIDGGVGAIVGGSVIATVSGGVGAGN
jgi:hypothetical protein